MLEDHGTAWNRAYYFRKLFKPKKVKGKPLGSRYMSDADCPIRLRGYTEVKMGNVDDRLRKKIDTTIRRGYQLENKTQLPRLMRLIEKHNPIAPIKIGYMGKTEFTLYMPTSDEAIDLQKELHAMTVMTDAFEGHKIRLYGVRVSCQITARADAKGEAQHLRAAFTELRPAIDSYMALWASEREAIARWCSADDAVIRVPFDSHKDIK